MYSDTPALSIVSTTCTPCSWAARRSAAESPAASGASSALALDGRGGPSTSQCRTWEGRRRRRRPSARCGRRPSVGSLAASAAPSGRARTPRSSARERRASPTAWGARCSQTARSTGRAALAATLMQTRVAGHGSGSPSSNSDSAIASSLGHRAVGRPHGCRSRGGGGGSRKPSLPSAAGAPAPFSTSVAFACHSIGARPRARARRARGELGRLSFTADTSAMCLAPEPFGSTSVESTPTWRSSAERSRGSCASS